MFKKMEYVYAVYKEGGFTKAAEKLYISQPCLSAAIKKIEDEIGMPLFERRYSDVRPTSIGMEYIKTAEKILALQQGFAAMVKDSHELEYGSLKLGGSNYMSSYILPRIVSEFSRLCPKIEISLVETNTVELEKQLGAEEIDLVIDSFDGDGDLLECSPLLTEKILLAVPAGCASNAGLEDYRITPDQIFFKSVDYNAVPQVSIEAFRNERFILLKNGHNMYRHAMTVFRESHFTPNVSFRMDQLLTSYALASSGSGVCFVTDTMFRYHHFRDDVYLYNVQGSGSRMLYIAKKRNRYTSAAMARFMELARQTMEQL